MGNGGEWERQLLALAFQAEPALISATVPPLHGDGLKEAYAHAERVTACYSKSFHFASALLPREKRLAVRALYAFCRTVDDIVDTPGDQDPQDQLDYWRKVSLTGTFRPGDRVAAAWSDTLARYHIPRTYALQLIDGVARDLVQTRYRTFDELTLYCYGVASTVGLMSMYIVGFADLEAIPYAIKLGVALQLTNILRDVAEDYRAGRVYLPFEELVRYGLDEEDIRRAKVDERWRRFMRFQVARVRELYAQAWPGVRLLSPDGQLAIGAAAWFYQGILDDIEEHDYDVFSRRAHLSGVEKVQRLIHLWLTMRSVNRRSFMQLQPR